MKKHWKDVLADAAPLIAFLERESFFGRAYSGATRHARVITDAGYGFRHAADDSFDRHDDWETVTDSVGVFPDWFEWSSRVDHNLVKNGFFGLASKEFNGADAKWTLGECCLLQELMHRDVRILLNCYSNDFFPDVWRDILDVYLADGFPCGWDGRYPAGKLLVFSNY